MGAFVCHEMLYPTPFLFRCSEATIDRSRLPGGSNVSGSVVETLSSQYEELLRRKEQEMQKLREELHKTVRNAKAVESIRRFVVVVVVVVVVVARSFFHFNRSRKAFRTHTYTFALVPFLSDLSMNISNFSKTIHTSFIFLLHMTKSMCIAVQLSKFFSTIVNFIMSAF